MGIDIAHNNKTKALSIAGIILTLGIVFGDIGTSPLYVMKAITSGRNDINTEFILGALSCIIWTLTIQTTLKYVIITLKADNKGEGGIFSLFALIRNAFRRSYLFAIAGGAFLLADGIITPAISVTSAVEGLHALNQNIPVIPIVLIILIALFFIQQFGTRFIGKTFGPVMLIWFSFLAFTGTLQLLKYPFILNAFNPVYAINLLTQYPGGFFILGAVFLCTTGAEALYSDLGHCGIKNIRISWIFVKISLILNYLGQGAWIINNNIANENLNPFFQIIPAPFNWFGIAISILATIIASQALISGSFTLISEAMSLNFWPRIKKTYPTHIKGQVYIPMINWILLIACCFVVLYFKESSKMEAAYGLSISITMMMTTFLLNLYLEGIKFNSLMRYTIITLFFTVESLFLIANLAKFPSGGWVAFIIAIFISIIMYAWFNARKIRNKFLVFFKWSDYEHIITDLSNDKNVPKFASNLVYITRANYKDEIESKILYSILSKKPKRADIYWMLHTNIVEDPRCFEYEITYIVPNKIIKIDLHLGFKIEPRVDLYFKQIIQEMVEKKEIDITSNYDSLHKHGFSGDFKYVVLDRVSNVDNQFNMKEKINMLLYGIINKIALHDTRAFGLDTSNVLTEKVPLISENRVNKQIKRIYK